MGSCEDVYKDILKRLTVKNSICERRKAFVAVEHTEPHTNCCCSADTHFLQEVVELLLVFLPIMVANALIMG